MIGVPRKVLRSRAFIALRWSALFAALAVFAAPVLFLYPAQARTTATVEGTTIVIQVPIDVRGLRGNTIRDLDTGEVFDATTYIEREVERIWNEAFQGFRYECWTFRLDLKLYALGYDTVKDKHTEGHHLIGIDPTASNNYWNETGPDDLCPDCDFPFAYTRDMTGVWKAPDPGVLAHEIGHALGLGDDYYKKGGYKPEAGGIGERAGGVYFVDKEGYVVQPGSFTTHGVGKPEPIHLWRVINMMKQASALPPCPVIWTGTVVWTAQHTPTHLVSSKATVRLREKEASNQEIELVHDGSDITVTHIAQGNDSCVVSGHGTSPATGHAGWLVREQSTGPNGEVRLGPWIYKLAITPAADPVWIYTCSSVDGPYTMRHDGRASGTWLAYIGTSSDPNLTRQLDDGRMIGSYAAQNASSWEDKVSWSICREGVVCPEVAALPGTSSTPPSPSASSATSSGSPAAPAASPAPAGAVPAALAPPKPNSPRGGGTGFLRP
jgi:hypothetical protein